MPKIDRSRLAGAEESALALEGADFGQYTQTYRVADVDEIKPHPKNPNRGDVELIADSIENNGWYGACIVQRDTGYILAGEHRWRSARLKGMLQIPVVEVDVDPVTAIRIMLVDNESTRQAQYDEEALNELLADLAPIEATELERTEALAGSGFSMAALEQFEQGKELAEAEFQAQEQARLAAARARAVGNAAGGINPADVPDGADTDTQYGILIVCDDEGQQREVYESVVESHPGLRVRVVAV